MNPKLIKEKKKLNSKKNSETNQNSLSNIKNKIIELVSSFLSHKFSKLFSEKNYSEKKLKNDLKNIITEKELENFRMEDTISVIEKNILEKLKITDYVNENLTQGNTSKNYNEEKSKSPYKTNLIQKLHQKENDQWSQIVKNQLNSFIQEKKEKLIKKIENKQNTKEFYEMQISEKDSKKKIEMEELEKFVKIRDENLKKIEETERKISFDAKEQFLSQKEMKIKMYNDFHNIKKSQKLKEELEEKNYVDRIILKKKEDQEKKLKKKEIVKDLYRNVYEQIENKLDRIKERSEKEKLENLKKSEEYSKILQQRDNERNKTIYKVLNKFEKKCEGERSPNFKFVDREEIKNLIGEERYREQSIEKEIKTQIEEENRKMWKIKNKEDMKSFLEYQMSEKNMKKAQSRIDEKSYVNEIRSSLEKFNLEGKIKLQKKKEELGKYKQELDMQFKEKNSDLGNFI